MLVGGKSYTWPAKVTFFRPIRASGENVSRLKLTIPTEGGKVNAKGEIHVYAYEPHDVDRYAVNDCDIDKDHLEKLKSGYAVTIDGFSAGAKARIYRIILGREE